MRVGLVGCVKQKAPLPMPAEELYVSALFRGRKAYVQRSCDSWYILSAKHGVLRPTDVVVPYNETLNGLPKAKKLAWSRRVLAALLDECGSVSGTAFEIHAGTSYRDFGLVDGLLAAGATVEVPTAGLSQGKQLSFYLHSPAPKPASASPSAAHDAGAGKGGPLTTWLAAASSPATLSFSDIERILGSPLPASARKHRAWWANSPSRTVPRQWLTAGWRAEEVEMASEQIRLVR